MGHKYDKPSIAEITKWVQGEIKKPSKPVKYNGPHYQSNKLGQQVTGPIDQAFCDKFIFVAPSGKSTNPRVTAWVEQEMQHQLRRWRELYRGEIRVVKDTELTLEDQRDCNLILWGDPQSNSAIRETIKKFPINWSPQEIKFGVEFLPADQLVLVGIYPKNKLLGIESIKGSIVFNSGITFREGHDKTNSQQTPKLPDWAVIDISVPPSDTAPGKVVSAGFFDKDWKFVDPASQKKSMGY